MRHPADSEPFRHFGIKKSPKKALRVSTKSTPFVEIRISTRRTEEKTDEFLRQNALKLAVFLGGNQFRLRIPCGKPFVSRTLPLF